MDNTTCKIPFGTRKCGLAIVDECDQDLAMQPWMYTHGYAISRKMELMHRIILERKLDIKLGRFDCVDHINGLRHDNRRENLRLSDYSTNQANRGPSSCNTTGYKGVYFDRTAFGNGKLSCYRADIVVRRKRMFLGVYKTPEEAARAYDKAAVQYFGEFAKTNF